MIVVSNNNFKDDFEKNRQSINPDEHQTELKEDDKTNENKKEADSQNSLSNNSNQQFPPRNAQRRKGAERQQLIKANNKTTNIKKIVTLKLQKVH